MHETVKRVRLLYWKPKCVGQCFTVLVKRVWMFYWPGDVVVCMRQ